MGKKRSTAEQIIGKLRGIEVLVGQGDTVSVACRKAGIGEAAYYRWRREYGGLKMDQAKRLKELEKENLRLKKVVADLSLDNAILREAASGNC